MSNSSGFSSVKEFVEEILQSATTYVAKKKVVKIAHKDEEEQLEGIGDYENVKSWVDDIITEATNAIILETKVIHVRLDSDELLTDRDHENIRKWIENIIAESINSIITETKPDKTVKKSVKLVCDTDRNLPESKPRFASETSSIDETENLETQVEPPDSPESDQLPTEKLKNALKIKSESFTKLSINDVEDEYAGHASEIVSPFELEWSFGFNFLLPVIRTGASKVFLASSHIGVVYDFETHDMKCLIGHKNKISCLCNAAGFLATADCGLEKSLVVLWREVDQAPIKFWEEPFPGGVCLLTISEDGLYVIAISAAVEPVVKRWSLIDKSETNASLPQDKGKAVHLVVNEIDSRHCAVTFSRHTCVCTAAQEDTTFEIQEPVVKYKKKLGNFVETAYNTPLKQLLTGTDMGQVIVFTVAGNYIKTVQLHRGEVSSLKAFNRTVALTYKDGSIWFYNQDLRLIHWFTEELGPIRSISYYSHTEGAIPDFIFLTSKGHMVKGSNGGREQRLLGRSLDNILSMVCDPKGPSLVVGDIKGQVSKYNRTTKSLELTRAIMQCGVSALQFSPNGATLVAGSEEGEIFILDPVVFTILSMLPTAKSGIVKFSFSNNSKHLVFYHKLMGVELFKQNINWLFRGKLKVHLKPIVGIVFGDNFLYTLGKDRIIAVYEFKHALRLVKTWQIEQTVIPTSIINVDQNLYVSNNENKIRQIDIETGEIIRTVHVPGKHPISQMLNEDGRIIYAAGKFIGAFELQSKRFGPTIQAHSHEVINIAASGDVVFTSGNDSVLMWKLKVPLRPIKTPKLTQNIEKQIARLFESGPILQSETIDCLRYLGVFPSDFESRNILRELEDPDVTQEEFREIYYNYKVRGPTIYQIRDALLTVSDLTRSGGPVVQTDRLVAALQNGLEPMTREKILDCINVLLSPTPTPPQMLLSQFVTNVMGLTASLLDDLPELSTGQT